MSPFQKWFFTRATYVIIAVSIGFGVHSGVLASQAEYIDPLKPGPFWQGVAASVIAFLVLMTGRFILLAARVTLWAMLPTISATSEDMRKAGRAYRGEE
ncbi:hypothetical protein [Microbacterium sp. 77mftsu3.1]|uniref:hypothetical protein n=1 Tax=Microbacterium sp. 77mftsu3.1 TaxID=1761802 RepID=UPI00036511FB|nr:hypothetical protein [Microbacterium sp. 77mftsu3.1]SDH42060.1 hypothetical protein SAMN04488590_3296 [Microbacterium sp. 77mftsu3.1]